MTKSRVLRNPLFKSKLFSNEFYALKLQSDSRKVRKRAKFYIFCDIAKICEEIKLRLNLQYFAGVLTVHVYVNE